MSYVYRKFSTLFKKGHFYDLFRIILKQKARPQSFPLVLKLKHDWQISPSITTVTQALHTRIWVPKLFYRNSKYL